MKVNLSILPPAVEEGPKIFQPPTETETEEK
jgi:hypothetical protein